jgi:hypothetical protein
LRPSAWNECSLAGSLLAHWQWSHNVTAERVVPVSVYSGTAELGWLDRHAAYTRTGHHSSQSGEWRDGAGFVSSLFLHHLSRDGDPQLHVHVAIWNRIQRGDGADDTWRTLDSRSLHGQRLGVAPVADRTLETRLTALGYVMVPRAAAVAADAVAAASAGRAEHPPHQEPGPPDPGRAHRQHRTFS